MSSHEKWLRQAAEEIRKEGHYGWGNTCEQAADRISLLEEALWAAYQDSGTPNDYDMWVAALLREQGDE